ncbi:hypothetical protein [Stieleria mannarensis]|uniref:hypothetical protein n=1 Tax=Stieleria mannarensis TaxID=2755585 RepID=UPI0016008102|nr:hypothetical protein [Rhodopirellula sp. JC639]
MRSTTPVDVAEFIGLSHPQDCNWSSGVSFAYDGGLFVTPSVDGWVLICGRDLPPFSESALAQVETRLSLFSERFAEAQVFATHRVVEYHVWARARDGVMTRGFGYVGESGVTLFDQGFDDKEASLGFEFIDMNDVPTEEELDAADWPSEEAVMEVARVWSICPVDLAERTSPGVGLAGKHSTFFAET